MLKVMYSFDHVTFAYPDKQPAFIISTVDAPPGSVIGLLGSTGSGKSTVISLLMRAYNVKEGKVMLDGQDIRSLQVRKLSQSDCYCISKKHSCSHLPFGTISLMGVKM